MPVQNMVTFNITQIPKDSVFVLDTNVLYFIHSGYYLPSSQLCVDYSNFVQNIMNNGFKTVVSSISVQELLFGIENKEYEDFLRSQKLKRHQYSKKDYRNNSVERAKVKNKLSLIMQELSIYQTENGVLNASDINSFINTFGNHKCDPIDYLLISNYDLSKTYFVSNDKDFQSITTANIITT